MVFNSKTRYHWFINKLHKNQENVIWEASATDMNNNDDTHCFESNYCLISFT